VVRCLEVLGDALMNMRESPDPRIHLEVALVRLTHPEADDSPAALLERIDRLEHALAGGVPVAAPAPAGAPSAAQSSTPAKTSSPARGEAAAVVPEETASAPPAAAPPTSAPSGAAASGGAAMARETLGAVRRRSQGSSAEAAPAAPAPAPPSTAAAPKGRGSRARAPESASGPVAGGGRVGPPVEAEETAAVAAAVPAGVPGTAPTRDDLVKAWGDGLLSSLPNRARARFRVGRFISVDGGQAVYGLPNETHRTYCEDVKADVERILGEHFGVPITLQLVVDADADGADGGVDEDGTGGASRAAVSARNPRGGGASTGPTAAAVVADPTEEPDLLDPEVLAAETDLAGAGLTPEERLKQAFPGAQEL